MRAERPFQVVGPFNHFRKLSKGFLLPFPAIILWLALAFFRPVRTGHNFTNDIGMEMVWVQPLQCWVGKYEVTEAEYEKVMGSVMIRPYLFFGPTMSLAEYKKREGRHSGPRKPVEWVSWFNAVSFCKKLTEIEARANLTPRACRYSLPSEKQWEVFVGDAKLEDAVTWLKAQNIKESQDVGSKGANNFGLYDVRGNVWEWCLDRYDSDFALWRDLCSWGADGIRFIATSYATIFHVKSTVLWGFYWDVYDHTADWRVLRGGAWTTELESSALTYRRGTHPDRCFGNGCGFRIVLLPYS